LELVANLFHAIDEFAETLEGIAAEQGSTDVNVVRQHYLESENRSGRYQRVIREALSEVFDRSLDSH
jgi:ribonuclease PH